MQGSTAQPKVFISYSWSSPQHEQWVLDLAERLSGDGIVVVLDKWNLKEGQDKHTFMEQMVNDMSIKKVLVICDSVYQSKADNRKGGVGTETQLISKEVYESTDQEKYIPIICEYDTDQKACIPHYMASRIYIDLSSDQKFEENYQKLIRNLYDKPLLKRPPLGTPPAYINDEEQTILKTSHKVSEIKNALLNDKRSANGLITDYLDTFIASLEDFRLTGGADADFDERVVKSLEKMTPLRDDFVDFTFTVFKYQESVEFEKFQDFFKKLIPYCYPPEQVQRYCTLDYDNYKFLIYELILYFVAILLHLRKYAALAYFINSQYFYRVPESNDLNCSGIEILNHSIRSLDEVRNKRLNLRRVSVMADLIKERSIRKDISFDEIKHADLVLFYITELQGNSWSWFPHTSIYKSRGSSIELFDKMISLRHFEKIKALFDVQNVEQLKKLVKEYIESNKDHQRRFTRLWDYDIRPIENVINPTKIGSIK